MNRCQHPKGPLNLVSLGVYILNEGKDILNSNQSLDCLTVDVGVEHRLGYCRYGNSSGRGKGGSVICVESITSQLW
jgi:hypothetical protein